MSYLVTVQGLLVRDGKVLMAHRRPGGKKPLMWEYPGGKIEKYETQEEAVSREFMEETGLDVLPVLLLNSLLLEVDDTIRINLYAVEQVRPGEPQPLASTAVMWVDPTWAADNLPMLPSVFLTYRRVMRYINGDK